ncbi:MAG TPA: PIG-L family deacetylase [Bacteroidota bacterium]|nr:PIG-L family deacetylase [Bacteroidota bacterium]
MRSWFSLLFVLILLFTNSAPAQLSPDPRFKTDILLVVAHPDDETAVGGYLARAIFDEHRTVSIVYCNRGTGGGNNAGVEQSAAMGLIREIEVRQATAGFGITNVWVLDGHDTPGQDLFQSLESWRQGAILEQIVRIIRLTRPEVVITWLPAYVSGENHGDHQASGVITTEAFDMAGDPTAFPAQVAYPRERTDINNANEGLRPWQPKKLYFFSDAAHPIKAVGVTIDLKAISPSRGVSYARLAAQLMAPHKTQADVSEPAIKALQSGDFSAVIAMLKDVKLIFGKSLVDAAPDAGLFVGITPGEIAYRAPVGYHPASGKGVSLDFGGVFSFYRDFRRAHDLERLQNIVMPEVTVAAGNYMFMPLAITNNTADTVTASLHAILPEEWTASTGEGTYRVPPESTLPVSTFLHAASHQPWTGDIRWELSIGANRVGACSMKVTLADWTLPE